MDMTKTTPTTDEKAEMTSSEVLMKCKDNILDRLHKALTESNDMPYEAMLEVASLIAKFEHNDIARMGKHACTCLAADKTTPVATFKM